MKKIKICKVAFASILLMTGLAMTGCQGDNVTTSSKPSISSTSNSQSTGNSSSQTEENKHVLSISSVSKEFTLGAEGSILKVGLAQGDTATMTDITWDDTSLNGIGTITELPDGNAEKGDNARLFTPTKVGSGSVKVTAKVENKQLEATLDIIVKEDYSSYTAISTEDDLLQLLSKKGAITDKYYLANDFDLKGKEFNGRVNESLFNGVLDGRGHSITNFTIKNSSEVENDKATGLFYMVGGTIRNLHLQGTIDSIGFSGLLAKEMNGGLIENCLFEASNVKTITDWTWCRNGVIVSTINNEAVIKNCVTSLDQKETGEACFPFVAYTWGGKQTFEHLYTNIVKNEQYPNYYPFCPDGTVQDSQGTLVDVVHTPFDSTAANVYNLDRNIWNVVDNQMPTLKK